MGAMQSVDVLLREELVTEIDRAVLRGQLLRSR